MLILTQYDFVCFNALLNILDPFVYIAGGYIKEVDVGEVLVIRMQDIDGRNRREETTRRPKLDGRTVLKLS